MNSTKKAARVAGLLYLLVSIPGAFSLLYIPSHFVVSGDATATPATRSRLLNLFSASASSPN
jgi:hypothetical protein